MTYKWEVEHQAGATPTNSDRCITQPWEYAHSTTDRHLPFPLAEDHIKTIRATWKQRRISGTNVKDLDFLRYQWWTDTGLPQWLWADTLGTKQFGIFPLFLGYAQSYEVTDTAPFGTPRDYSGDRTYSFASFDGSQPFGVPRDYSGRDYIVEEDAHGTPRLYASDVNALGMIYARIPRPLDLESETPVEIHPKLHKYLRAYVLRQAFDRQGPGRNPTLSAYYGLRYSMGLVLFRKMAFAILRDAEWQRDMFKARDFRPPRVQLPPEFPRLPV